MKDVTSIDIGEIERRQQIFKKSSGKLKMIAGVYFIGRTPRRLNVVEALVAKVRCKVANVLFSAEENDLAMIIQKLCH